MAERRPKRVRAAEHKLKKKGYDHSLAKTCINIGEAFQRWRDLRELKGMKTDVEVAVFLLDCYENQTSTYFHVAEGWNSSPDVSVVALAMRVYEFETEGAFIRGTIYLRTKSESLPERSSLKRSSSTETCDSVHYEYPFMMSSSNDSEQETCADPSVQSSKNGKEMKKKDAACQKPKNDNDWTPTKGSENKVNRVEEEEDEEFSTSLSVGDGHYLVDLGSSSEFIVDEECILQLFKSCRECNGQCTVRKHVKGLKLVVYQACRFCQSCSKWTNLPDDDGDDKDNGDSQINGKDTAYEQNTELSPGSNTS